MNRWAALALPCLLAACASPWLAEHDVPISGPLCVERAPRAERVVPANASAQQAFQNYYEAFLDAKEERKYVDCLRQRWSMPRFHAEYRRARRQLKASKAEVAKNEPLVGQDKRISDVQESLQPQDAAHVLRRVTITLRDGTRTVVEETLPKEGPRPERRDPSR